MSKNRRRRRKRKDPSYATEATFHLELDNEWKLLGDTIACRLQGNTMTLERGMLEYTIYRKAHKNKRVRVRTKGGKVYYGKIVECVVGNISAEFKCAVLNKLVLNIYQSEEVND